MLSTVTDYREIYFSRMQDFTAKVQPLLQEYLNSYCFDGEIIPCLEFFFEKRKKVPWLMRPFLVRLAYEAVGGKDINEILPIAAISEFINISSYQANSALDSKYGIFKQLEKDNQVIAAMITLEMVESIICNMSCDTNIKDRIRRLYYEANRCMYYGQFYELNTLHYDNLDYSQITLDEYLEVYIKKCKYIGGIFLKNVAISGALLATNDQNEIEYLGEYAENFGIGLGIINDMSDYVPSYYLLEHPSKYDFRASYKTKKPEDQYSDVKNGRIFLPVFYALTHGNSDERAHIIKILKSSKQKSSNTIKEQDLKELTFILDSTGALRFAKSQALKHMKLAKESLHKLEKNVSRDLLSVMLSSIRTNKYIYYLRKLLEES